MGRQASLTSTPPASAAALDAYEHLAPYYDAFTAHHDYELWLGNLLAAADRLGLRGNRLLDAACGTGKSFLPMLERGWRVTATDLAPAMVERARAKVNGEVNFGVFDVKELPVLGSFDLVWCLDDALNYLESPEELALALRRLGSNLAEGGLIIFDLNTLLTYRTFFASRHSVAIDGASLEWRGQANSDFPAGSSAVAELSVIEPEATGPRRSTTLHRQQHFTPDEVARAVASAGLEIAATVGHGYDAVLERPLDESRHTKAIFFVKQGERR